MWYVRFIVLLFTKINTGPGHQAAQESESIVRELLDPIKKWTAFNVGE